MKQYVIKRRERELLPKIRKPINKKVPLSRCIPPWTGSGRINAPHGGRNLYVNHWT